MAYRTHLVKERRVLIVGDRILFAFRAGIWGRGSHVLEGGPRMAKTVWFLGVEVGYVS